MCINLELKSGSFSYVFKTWLFSDIYYCWHQVRCERETYETRGTDWASCPVSQSIHHLWLCFSRIVFCICVCLSNNPPPPTLFCFVLVSCPVSQSIHQSTSGFVFFVLYFVFVFVFQTIHHQSTTHFVLFCVSLMPCLPINPPVHLRLCFSRILFVFVSISVCRIPINPPPAALFISILACLSIIHQYLS